VDASARHAPPQAIRIVAIIDSKRLGPNLPQLFQPFDRRALRGHFTLENLGFS
jgi:hypothetical protein